MTTRSTSSLPLGTAPALRLVPRTGTSCRFLVLGLFLVMASLTIHSSAQSEPPSPGHNIESALKETATDLEESRPREAIRTLEALADRGVFHPDLSFNRALAYLARAQTPTAQIGDLGQAAAAFAEVEKLRPDDKEAEVGREDIQRRVARQQKSKDITSENRHLGLAERVLLALSPFWLFLIALSGSLGLTVGLLLRRASSETKRLAGNIAVGVGVFIVALASGLAASHGALFAGSRPAVVITEKAFVVDMAGARLKGHPPLGESTLVHVGSSTRGLVPLVGLGSDVWVRASQLRVLAGD